MWGIPKIVIERFKGRTVGSEGNRQLASDDRQFRHPDANLLAAFLERRLTERERTQVLTHLAACVECREIVALTLPSEAQAAEPAGLPVRSGWSVRPVLGWGALAAALGAVVVVAVLRQPSRSRVQTASNNVSHTVAANVSETARQSQQPLAPQLTSSAATRRTKRKSLESAGEVAKLQTPAATPQARQVVTLSAGVEQTAPAPRTRLTPAFRTC